MPKLLFALAAVLLSHVSAAANPSFAFQEGVEAFVERDSSAFIVIDNPQAMVELFEASAFFENRCFKRALELLIDEEFSLLTEGDFQQLQDQWSNLRNELGRVREIAIVVHSWGKPDSETGHMDDWILTVPKVSCVLIGTSETSSAIAAELGSGKSLILDSVTKSGGTDSAQNSEKDSDTNGDEQVTGESEDEELLDQDYDVFSKIFRDLKNVSVTTIGNAVVISNDAQQSAELVKRMEDSTDKKFRPLSRQRTYQQVQKLLGEPTAAPEIRGYLVPKSFPEFTTELITDNFYLSPKTLPAAGFKISLLTDGEDIQTPDGTYRPTIDWNYVMTFTKPATEFSRLIQSFEPIDELLPIPLPVTSLNVIGFDVEKRNQAHEDIIKVHRMREKLKEMSGVEEGDLDAEEPVPEIERDDLFSNLEDIDYTEYANFGDFEAYGTVAQFKRFDPDSLAGSLSLVLEANRNCKIHDFVEAEAIRVYAVSDPVAAEKFFRQTINVANQYLLEDGKLVEVDCDQGLLFARNQRAVREHWTANVHGGLEIPQTGPLGDDIMCGEFELFLNDQWMVYADHVTMKHLLEVFAGEAEPTPQAFELILADMKEQLDGQPFFKVAYTSNQLNDKRNWIEGAHIIRKYANDELQMRRLFASEPDEYGLRNELESPDDALAAVKQLISTAFNDTFGTSISLYSNEKSNMRIFGQIYSLVDSSDGN